jgi:hypothetical protein
MARSAPGQGLAGDGDSGNLAGGGPDAGVMAFHEDTGQLLLVSFDTGAKLFRLDRARPAAALVWETKQVTTLMVTPLFQDGHFFVADNYGNFTVLTRRPAASSGVRASLPVRPNGENRSI